MSETSREPELSIVSETQSEVYRGSDTPTGSKNVSVVKIRHDPDRKRKIHRHESSKSLNTDSWPCMEERWTCEHESSFWRAYMKVYADGVHDRENEDRFKRRKPANLLKLPYVKSSIQIIQPFGCVPHTIFQLAQQTELPSKLDRDKKIRIWRSMRKNLLTARSSSATAIPDLSEAEKDKWPAVWPCVEKDFDQYIRERERSMKKKRRDVFPCDPYEDGPSVDKRAEMFAKLRELGHVRLPTACAEDALSFMVDRDVGERIGFVDGEYFVVESSLKGKPMRAHADVCVRGLKGMHLVELGPLRRREKTWKFCFYQAVVALLAKTQLRYKYIWNMNIDYIYDHAWTLYSHIGMINVQERQRLDDIVVYNYKYSVEVELVQELKDVPIVTDVNWKYEGKGFRRKTGRERPELLEQQLELGTNKLSDSTRMTINKGTRVIEDWFDKLDIKHRNCILRTSRFALAFWRDGMFWYLYNPYRCDEFGYWDDSGYACMLKFCSKESLKRHMMVLMLRAYVYCLPISDARISFFDIFDPEQHALPVCSPDRKPATAPKEEEEDEEGRAESRMESRGVSLAESVASRGESRGVSMASRAESRGVSMASRAESRGISMSSRASSRLDSRGLSLTESLAEELDESPEEETPEAPPEPPPEPYATSEKTFTIQIFRMIYHCCQIHNLKLLERTPPKPDFNLVKKKPIDDCPFDPLDLRDACAIEQAEDEARDDIEKPSWLKLFKITWAKSTGAVKKKNGKEASSKSKMRWHQYLVEESNRLFSLWGELHITDGMFDKENRGMQTYACYVVCAGMTRLMAPEYWSSKTLDVIVMCGDRYYTQSKLEAEFKSTKAEFAHVTSWDKYLMSHFKIGETMFEARVLPAVCGRLYMPSGKYLWKTLEQLFQRHQFAILTCENTCLGVFKFCGAYYVFDVTSFGPPLFGYGMGAAYLIRATFFQKFLTVLIVTIGSPECSSFALNPIEILKVMDMGPADTGERKMKRKERRLGGEPFCPYDAEKKKQMKKWKIRRAEDTRIIDKTCCKNFD